MLMPYASMEDLDRSCEVSFGDAQATASKAPTIPTAKQAQIRISIEGPAEDPPGSDSPHRAAMGQEWSERSDSPSGDAATPKAADAL
jgi:hypothetical protein